jgi:hypothetical protein
VRPRGGSDRDVQRRTPDGDPVHAGVPDRSSDGEADSDADGEAHYGSDGDAEADHARPDDAHRHLAAFTGPL